jgi:hypothetical protein
LDSPTVDETFLFEAAKPLGTRITCGLSHLIKNRYNGKSFWPTHTDSYKHLTRQLIIPAL